MSAWRLVVKEIHQRGPIRGTAGQSPSLRSARLNGLIEHNADGEWCLTPLGLDVAENRVKPVQLRPGGRRFVATWLRALPRGLSLSGASA